MNLRGHPYRLTHDPIMPALRSSREPSASLRSAQPAADWLPQARSPLLMSNSRVAPFVEAKKNRHWFIAFANAIYQDQDDHHQGGMLAKLYAFLHDFLPCGFTGRWAHIHGNDVMDVLLSHTKEFSFTRHRATSGAAAAFEHLGDWMSKGSTWQEAMFNAEGGRKKRSKPVLYSPEQLAALLVIAYPDVRYRELVGRLQVGWMMGPRAGLEVHDGFWEGITEADLDDVFEAEKKPVSSVVRLADYDRLLGLDFTKACKDIRPHLPRWAQDLGLSLTPLSPASRETSVLSSVVEVGGAEGQDGDAPTQGESGMTDVHEPEGIRDDEPKGDEASRLYALLTETTKPLQGLRKWLAAQLAMSDDIFSFWCHHWTDKMGAARNYKEQVITQSLFVQSLHSLYNISSAPAFAAYAIPFMLLDVEDTRTEQRSHDAKEAAATERMRSLPLYKPGTEAEEELIRAAADDSLRQLLRTAFSEQMAFFYDLFRDGRFNKHAKDTVSLSALRTRALLGDGVRSGAAGQVDDKLATGLQLTRWQLRQAAVAGPGPQVLTGWQERIYHNRVPGAQDLSHCTPVDPVGDFPDGSPAHQETLRKLLGDLEQPIAANGTDCDRGRGTPASQAAGTPAKLNGHSRLDSSPRVNPYATLSKRSRSPEVRTVKFPRLAGSRVAFEEEVRTDIAALGSTLNELRSELQAIRAVAASKDAVSEYAQKSLDSSASLAGQLNDACLDLGGKIQSLEARMTAQDQQTATRLAAITDSLEDLRQHASKKTPAPGQDGYLTERCPAPPGWDQKLYDSMLMRAGASYAAHRGMPEEGFEPDAEAFELIMEAFPAADVGHLQVALDHVHRLMYNRPYQPPDGATTHVNSPLGY